MTSEVAISETELERQACRLHDLKSRSRNGCLLIDIRIGGITGIAANGTQAGATPPL